MQVLVESLVVAFASWSVQKPFLSVVAQAMHQFLKSDPRLPALQTDTVASEAVAEDGQPVHNVIRIRPAVRAAGQGGGRQRGQQGGKKGNKRGRVNSMVPVVA